MSFTGRLAETSALRIVFPDNKVPLAAATQINVKLGEDAQTTPCYFLALAGLTDKQKELLAGLMADGGQGTKEDCLAFVAKAERIPIRMIHFVGQASAELRQFI